MREVREFVVLVLVIVAALFAVNVATGGELPHRLVNFYDVVFDTLTPGESAPDSVDGVPVERAVISADAVNVATCTRAAQGQGREVLVVLPTTCHKFTDSAGHVTVAHPAGGTLTYLSTHKWGGVVWQAAR